MITVIVYGLVNKLLSFPLSFFTDHVELLFFIFFYQTLVSIITF